MNSKQKHRPDGLEAAITEEHRELIDEIATLHRRSCAHEHYGCEEPKEVG
jgi:hypothetical protein